MAEPVAPAVVELRRARRGVVRHRRRLFQGAAVLEVGRDPGRPEALVAQLVCDAGVEEIALLASGRPRTERDTIAGLEQMAREFVEPAAKL